jgi:hypothetical protein
LALDSLAAKKAVGFYDAAIYFFGPWILLPHHFQAHPAPWENSDEAPPSVPTLL